jgi:hypothetical protein
MKWLRLTFVVLLVTTVLVFASEDRHSPINEKTLVGTWEAISTRDVSVYRMEIRGQGDSYLSFAVRGIHWVYKLEKMEVKNGEVFLSFVDPKNTREKIHVRGSGFAGWDGIRNEGVIDAQLIMDPGENPLNKWMLEFIKAPHIEVLYELSKSAEEAIREIKSKK